MTQPTPKYKILQHFSYGHLPPRLQYVSQLFADVAHRLTLELAQGQELNASLRKLLEAKDAAIRAAIDSGWLNRTVDHETGLSAPTSYEADPITGNPLPTGSPYSMARTATRVAGEPVKRAGPPTPRQQDYPHGFRRTFPTAKQYQDANGVYRWEIDHKRVPIGLEAGPPLPDLSDSCHVASPSG